MRKNTPFINLGNHSEPHKGEPANGSATTPASPSIDKKRADLVTLFRLLLRQPSADHDTHTCPTCKRYDLTEI